MYFGFSDTIEVDIFRYNQPLVTLGMIYNYQYFLKEEQRSSLRRSMDKG